MRRAPAAAPSTMARCRIEAGPAAARSSLDEAAKRYHASAPWRAKMAAAAASPPLSATYKSMASPCARAAENRRRKSDAGRASSPCRAAVSSCSPWKASSPSSSASRTTVPLRSAWPRERLVRAAILERIPSDPSSSTSIVLAQLDSTGAFLRDRHRVDAFIRSSWRGVSRASPRPPLQASRVTSQRMKAQSPGNWGSSRWDRRSIAAPSSWPRSSRRPGRGGGKTHCAIVRPSGKSRTRRGNPRPLSTLRHPRVSFHASQAG